MHLPGILLALSLLLLGACGGGKNESDSDASDDTGATGTAATASDSTDSTIGMSSSPTTTGDDASGTSNPTTGGGGSGTADAESTAGGQTTTSASETTGTTDGDPELMQLCMNWCGKNAECKPESDPDACVQGCVQELGGGEPLCAEATLEMLACMLEMTCAEFVAFTDNDEPGPCAVEADAVENACAGDVCTGGIGSNPDGTECSYTIDCPNEPSLEMKCDVDTCTCFSDGMEVGSCESQSACMDAGPLPKKAEICCGF